MLKIRLARGGAKKRPYYYIVVADSQIVPGAHACSFDFVYVKVGNSQTSSFSPTRSTVASATAVATTSSVFSGKCGPCCSIAPRGCTKIDLDVILLMTSGPRRSPRRRIEFDMTNTLPKWQYRAWQLQIFQNVLMQLLSAVDTTVLCVPRILPKPVNESLSLKRVAKLGAQPQARLSLVSPSTSAIAIT